MRNTPSNGRLRLAHVGPSLAQTQDRLFYCERSTATPTSPEHIRLIPAGEEPMLGGGINDKPLCGADLFHGWDLYEVTLDNLARSIAHHRANPQHLPGRTCEACSTTALALGVLS